MDFQFGMRTEQELRRFYQIHRMLLGDELPTEEYAIGILRDRPLTTDHGLACRAVALREGGISEFRCLRGEPLIVDRIRSWKKFFLRNAKFFVKSAIGRADKEE